MLTEPVVHTEPSVHADEGATTHSTTGTPGDGHGTPLDAHTAAGVESLPPSLTTIHQLTTSHQLTTP